MSITACCCHEDQSKFMMDIFTVKAVCSPTDESQRRQYEEWLGETQRLLQLQQRLLEDQIAAHRKTKKSLSAKQRTAKKAGRAFAEEDAAQLRNVTKQQGAVQKQLEQVPSHRSRTQSVCSVCVLCVCVSVTEPSLSL